MKTSKIKNKSENSNNYINNLIVFLILRIRIHQTGQLNDLLFVKYLYLIYRKDVYGITYILIS